MLEGTEYSRLEDKILFLIAKFGGRGGQPVKRGDTLWQEFQKFKDTRDALVHPKQDKEVVDQPASREEIHKDIQ